MVLLVPEPEVSDTSAFNGGCKYNEAPTGWEPGNGLPTRVRELFLALGGNIRDIPLKEMINVNTAHDEDGPLEIVTKFPTKSLPGGSLPILKAHAKFGKRVEPVMEYLFKRGDFYFYDEYAGRFWWSPDAPDMVIIPFFHYDRVVGWLGRHIRGTGPSRFKQAASSDYLFNQHYLKTHPDKHILVMESPMSAVPLHGVATRSNRFSEKQVNLFRAYRKEPILIPDYKGEEWQAYLKVASREGWWVSTPNWKYKDVGEAMQNLGCLPVVKMLMESKTKDYKMAETIIKKNVMVMEA